MKKNKSKKSIKKGEAHGERGFTKKEKRKKKHTN